MINNEEQSNKELAALLMKSDMNHYNLRIKKLITIKDILQDALSYLYFNDISLKTYFSNENPITPKPLCRLSKILTS